MRQHGPVNEIFRHAVASFDPTEVGVLLWTRLGDGPAQAEWVIAADPDLRDVVATGTATTTTAQDRTIVVDVEGLEAATTYWYRFTSGGERSPVGRTRTLPRAPTGHFRLGLVCCAHYAVAPLGVYRAMAEREVDLVLHLGDYMYEEGGGKGSRRHRPPWTAISLEDYRQRLAQLREDPDLQALHIRHPMTTIWDDHDLSDNAWRGGAKKHDPERDGPWESRVEAAAQARQEWLPARLRNPQDALVTWRTARIGDLATLILLDTRFTGRDRQAGDDEAKDLHDPARSLLGGEQRRWLQTELAECDTPWAVVASGVVVNQLYLPMRWAKRVNPLLPNGYAVLDGEVMHDDQWDGYPGERDRLAAALGERGGAGGRTVLLSGDVHSSWAFEGPCQPGEGAPVAVEFTAPAVSSAAMGRAHYPGAWRVIDRAVTEMEHVCWAEVTERGYVVVDITPDKVQAEWWFVHPYDVDPAATAELGASFFTEHDPWPPRLVRATTAATEPDRRGLPAPLPPRPADLQALRWRRRLRLTAKAAGLIATLVALPVSRQHRRRRKAR